MIWPLIAAGAAGTAIPLILEQLVKRGMGDPDAIIRQTEAESQRNALIAQLADLAKAEGESGKRRRKGKLDENLGLMLAGLGALPNEPAKSGKKGEIRTTKTTQEGKAPRTTTTISAPISYRTNQDGLGSGSGALTQAVAQQLGDPNVGERVRNALQPDYGQGRFPLTAFIEGYGSV